MNEHTTLVNPFESLPPWGKRLLINLGVLYLLEVVAGHFLHWLPVSTLMWWPSAQNGQLYQIVTRYFVQGDEPLWVAVSLVIFAMFLPVVDSLPRAKRFEFLAFVIAGGSSLAVALDATGLLRGPGYGWAVFLTPLFALFGLQRPKGTVLLFFVLPVSGEWIVKGTGVIALLSLLAKPSIGAADQLGAFLGALAFWNLRGDGARRRSLKQKSQKIVKDLHNFHVIQGGLSGNRDDEIFH